MHSKPHNFSQYYPRGHPTIPYQALVIWAGNYISELVAIYYLKMQYTLFCSYLFKMCAMQIANVRLFSLQVRFKVIA